MELEFPSQEDLIRYAEGIPSEPALEKQIKKILASNSLVRSEIAEIKKELYRLECQLPQYNLSPEFGAELAKMSEAWCSLRARQKLSFKNFWGEKELVRVLLVFGFFLAVITAIHYFLV